QNRLEEKRGCSTSVAPAQKAARAEYDSALVWNSGRTQWWTSEGRSASWVAQVRPAHRALAWVQSTAFGRLVVPEVYWIPIGSSAESASRGPGGGASTRRSAKRSPGSQASATSGAAP